MHKIILIKHLSVFAFETLQVSKLNLLYLGVVLVFLFALITFMIRSRNLNSIIKQYQSSNSNLENEIKQLRTEISHQTSHLELAIQKSEEANHLKSLFLANMSHEVRTPLNAIMGFSELIVSDDFEPAAKKIYGDHIIQNSQNLLKLIDQIFHLSIIETGKVRINKERFKIADLIQPLERELKSKLALSNKKIQLLINIENPEYVINTDKEKLKHILDNLLDNSIKFTNQGIIDLTCIRLEHEFLFQISDSGSGIKEDEYEMIFDPFTQGSETLRKILGGSGLGLSNVKNYVILLGGKVWCEGNKPNGSIFSFTIPAPFIKEKELLKMLKYSMFQN